MHFLKILSWLIFIAINIFLLYHLVFPVFLFIVHWFLHKNPDILLKRYKKITDKEFDFAVITAAHQETMFIAPFVDSLIRQEYQNFVIYVVADDCDISGLHFSDDKVVLLKPESPLHSKIKSIKYAIDHFRREHDALVIFDSDNLAHPDFLKNLNRYFQRGFAAVQANMLSKNLDSGFARMDAMGHTYYNFLERKIKMELGLTSAILGLGIAMDLDLYRRVVYKNNLGGFDKKLQVNLTLSVPMIAYAGDVIVYDEKVENAAAFEKQRTRWIFTYFEYFKDSIFLFRKSFKPFNAGRLLLAISMLRPPMILTISVSIICMASCFLIFPVFGWIWLAIFILFTINFILIVASQSQQEGVWKALFSIPALLFRQIKSLLKIKKAKKNFLQTEHKKVLYINEVLHKI